MRPAFDPYHQWLGIRPEEHPVDHYRLLGIVKFEGDRDVIANACDRLMSQIRTFQTGPRGVHTQEVLTRLAAARACLLDVHAKSTYDAVLHGQMAAEAKSKATTQLHAAPMASAYEPATAVLPPPPPPPMSAPLPPPVEYGPMTPAAQVVVQQERLRTPPRGDQPVEYIDKPAPIYFQPWFLVLVVAGVLLVAVSAWGIGSMIGRGREEAQTPPAETDPVVVAPPVEEEPKDETVYIQQEAGGELNFTAGTAQLSGNARLAEQSGQSVVTEITSVDDRVRWHFRVEKPGPFRVEATYAAPPGSEGGTFKLSAGEQTTKAITVRNTGAAFTSERVGFMWVRRGGKHELVLSPVSLVDGQSLLTLQSLRFIPVSGSGE